MQMPFKKRLRNVLATVRDSAGHAQRSEDQMLLMGRMLSELVSNKPLRALRDAEFRVFSQFGDDGIIQWLIHQIDFPNQTFIEFGVEDYHESNTRFLMMNDNWSGMVIDGSSTNIAKVMSSRYYWRHHLLAKSAFIDRDNINALLASSGFAPDIGILHIDLDGNDYWIWQAVEVVSPLVVILEYNAVFGAERAVSVPYDPVFFRTEKHKSNLYFGASLPALHRLSHEKGYRFIGCNSAGNNAYFVRSDKLNERIREVSLREGFVNSRFRESRDDNGVLTYVSGDARIEVIRGMPVHNVVTGQVEAL